METSQMKYCLILSENKVRRKINKTLNNIFEPVHDKTNKMSSAPNEDSDQPGYPPSLISFTVLMDRLGSELPMERTAKTLIRMGECPG